MEKEVIIHSNNMAKTLKSLITYNGTTISAVKRNINEAYGRNDKIANFTRKLNEDKLYSKELIEVAEILGYEVIFRKK